MTIPDEHTGAWRRLHRPIPSLTIPFGSPDLDGFMDAYERRAVVDARGVPAHIHAVDRLADGVRFTFTAADPA